MDEQNPQLQLVKPGAPSQEDLQAAIYQAMMAKQQIDPSKLTPEQLEQFQRALAMIQAVHENMLGDRSLAGANAHKANVMLDVLRPKK